MCEGEVLGLDFLVSEEVKRLTVQKLKFIYTEFMNTIKLQQRGLLTLPKKLRDALSLKEGQILTVEHTNGKIILAPQTSTVDSELAHAITQGLEDIKRGKFIEFGSTAEFHKKLKHYAD